MQSLNLHCTWFAVFPSISFKAFLKFLPIRISMAENGIFFSLNMLVQRIKTYQPLTCTVLDTLSFPAALSAVHVYWPSSCSSASLIVNEPSSWTLYLPPLAIFCPSFVHVTVGVGMPLVGHLMVMPVLVSAVTLSPIVKVIGLRSWASNIFASTEVSITGFEGSVRITTKIWYNCCWTYLVSKHLFYLPPVIENLYLNWWSKRAILRVIPLQPEDDRLSKHRSTIIVLFRSSLTRAIKFHQVMSLPSFNIFNFLKFNQ